MKTLKLKQWYDCCQNNIYVKNVIDLVYKKEIAYFHLNFCLRLFSVFDLIVRNLVFLHSMYLIEIKSMVIVHLMFLTYRQEKERF